jgi:hypothetical protein
MSPDTAELAGAERADTVPDDDQPRRHDPDARTHVRASDIEPYIGLRYLSKLFRFMAIILVLLLLAEVVTGLMKQGRTAIPTLLGEMSRLIVLAGLLWGVGDLAILLIDVGHDVRAARILLGRQITHHDLDHAAATRAVAPERQAESPHRRSTEITTR